MRALIVGPEDRGRWNDFVAGPGRGHVMQAYEWGEVMRRQGWEPVRIAALQGEAFCGAMALYLRRIPVVPWSLAYSPYGPVLRDGDGDALACLAASARRVGAARRSVFLQLFPDLLAADREALAAVAAQGFGRIAKQGILRLTQPLWTYTLDIGRPEAEILAAMKKKTRYGIRFSARKGVRVEERRGAADLECFHALLVENGRRKDFPVRGLRFYRSIWKELAPAGLARLFFARCGGETVAAELAFVFGETCYGMYRASSPRGRSLQANYSLVWEVIRWARRMGLRRYDLRGVASFAPPADHSGYGVFKFKEGWGGTPRTYAGDYYHIVHPALYRAWEAAERAFNMAGIALLKTYYRARRGGRR
ncbi:MAG: peptidoglycan bridge formation glycyltransferase FemA/FemB family protein [Desulfobacterales bacterium]|jgi:lipid II:glycine glycyltransferase (peptidoglycan interpeptide bridge formation enzyme)|nr:peptidoglycan bridge formation glycyltransferase FemA/FemB family protein [Desulfobacterales bacterium]